MLPSLNESRLPPLGNSFLNFVDNGGNSDEDEWTLKRSRSFAGYMSHNMKVLMCARAAAVHERANGSTVAVCKNTDATRKCDECSECSQGSTRCWNTESTSDETGSVEHQVEVNASDGCQQAAAEAAAEVGAAACNKEVSTLMLRNLPRIISQDVLARVITRMGFADKIDFLYVPSEFGTKRALGLAFANFSCPAEAVKFTKAWSRQRPLVTGLKGDRLVRILPASIQGYDANVEKWAKTAKQRIRNPLHRPLVAYGGILMPYAGKGKHGLPAAC
jgi:hypothetical protein